MDTKKIVEMLHPLERKVFPVLKEGMVFDEIVDKSALKGVEVMRALQWLQNKEIIKLHEDIKEIITLGDNGKKYVKDDLPEYRFLKSLTKKKQSVDDVAKKLGLNRDEVSACIGLLKMKAAIEISKGMTLDASLTANGEKLLQKKSLEQKFMQKTFPVEIATLTPEEKYAFENLKRRKKVIQQEIVKTKTVSITSIGKKLLSEKISGKVIDSLTQEMLKSSSWKNKNFRRYDIKINVPSINGGRRHFLNEVINYIRKIWIELGFKEMTGNLVQTSFWNFDALFTPQDHPTRELQDTFFIKDPSHGVPKGQVINNVQKTHENGWTTSSLGWQYKWDTKTAAENVLRTHTTVLSAKTIASLKATDLPAKFFSVGKCFRNETLDWSHLFEFNQVEGIVIDENANFKNLIGYLREFFRKMGYGKVRIRPAYFPYTEPSAEVDVFDPVHKKWIELGGAGIFRPEMVKPLLGKEVSVLAWGMGLGRIVKQYYNITDIRELYKNDIQQLRNIKEWLK